MAKSSKVEDYWRQHNIENLFKELTHILVQRMPSDPAVAIVQHLQKKFPKSFKTSIDNNNSDIGVVSKTMTNNLQIQSLTSPRSDINIESINNLQSRRDSSNQSQISGIVTIPTAGSAFTNLFKQDNNQTPELSLKNLVFANRLSQQAVKMGKDIRSDREILEEEFIKPIKTKLPLSTTTNLTTDLHFEDFQNSQTYEELSVPQLIKYKQQIRNENDRRLHRQKLADLAKQEREKEQILQPKSDEIQQLEGDQQSSQVDPETSNTKLYKPMVKSKEEEEILDDENIFQPRKHRQRGRLRNKLPTSSSNAPYTRRRDMTDFEPSMKRSAMPIMQFGVCKVCGSAINGEENLPIVYPQQVSVAPTARPEEPPPTSRSVATTVGAVDDWFESASEVSGSRQVSPWAPDDVIPPPTGSNTFRRTLFKPINDDNNTSTVEHRPPAKPFILIDNGTKTNRSTTPRISESGVFARSPESKLRRSSSSRSVPSPVTKKHQSDTPTVASHQLAKTIAHPTASRPISSSPLSTTMPSTNVRRMSGWSVREHSPDESDEN